MRTGLSSSLAARARRRRPSICTVPAPRCTGAADAQLPPTGGLHGSARDRQPDAAHARSMARTSPDGLHELRALAKSSWPHARHAGQAAGRPAATSCAGCSGDPRDRPRRRRRRDPHRGLADRDRADRRRLTRSRASTSRAIAVLVGDYLEPFVEPTLPDRRAATARRTSTTARCVLFGRDRREMFGDGDMLSIDRGTAHGVDARRALRDLPRSANAARDGMPLVVSIGDAGGDGTSASRRSKARDS